MGQSEQKVTKKCSYKTIFYIINKNISDIKMKNSIVKWINQN